MLVALVSVQEPLVMFAGLQWITRDCRFTRLVARLPTPVVILLLVRVRVCRAVIEARGVTFTMLFLFKFNRVRPVSFSIPDKLDMDLLMHSRLASEVAHDTPYEAAAEDTQLARLLSVNVMLAIVVAHVAVGVADTSEEAEVSAVELTAVTTK